MTIRSFLHVLCLLGTGLTALPSYAAGESQARLQRFLNEVRSLSAQFEQTQYDDHGAVVATRNGSFVLARPGRFLWRYRHPYEQIMICDGTRLWNYEPDLAQASVRSAGQILADTPAALLAQGDRLEERFVITGGDGGALRLAPRTPDADFRLIELWLAAAGTPQRIRFHDPLGGISDVHFSEVQLNPRLAGDTFRFVPPPGTEVVQLDE